MGELIEGFDESVHNEYARLRNEIAVAIAASGYTMEQVSALAGISRRTLHNLLTGSASVGTDTLIRVAFIVGGRLEVARPEGEGARPFQVVPSESPSTSSRRSSRSSAGGGNQTHAERVAARKKTAEQRKGSPPKRRDTRGWVAEAA